MVEIRSRSGIRDLWNLVGRSLNSLTKSSSSSSSSQKGLISFSGCFDLVTVFEDFSEDGAFFFSGGGESFELGDFVVILFLDELDLDRSVGFFIEEVVGFVEFEDLVPEVSFLSSKLLLVVLEEDLVELSLDDVPMEVLASLVWFLLEDEEEEEEEIGLMSLV